MGWFIVIVLVVMILGAVGFCVWYLRKDINEALALLVKFIGNRIEAKVAKMIGGADAIEEGGKEKILAALDNAKKYLDSTIDGLMGWVSNLDVVKKKG